MNVQTKSKLEAFIKKYGEAKLEAFLDSHENVSKDGILTVVVNEDTHMIPDSIIVGEKYVVSKGSFDTEDTEKLESQIFKSLEGLVRKLKEKNWNKIYLIPSGFPELSIMTKLLIYRTTRIDSVDIMYIGSGKYHYFNFDSRELSKS